MHGTHLTNIEQIMSSIRVSVNASIVIEIVQSETRNISERVMLVAFNWALFVRFDHSLKGHFNKIITLICKM